MLRTDEQIDLEAALAKLTPRQREVVVLWVQGYNQQELADKYGVHQATIGRWITEAAQTMSEYFK